MSMPISSLDNMGFEIFEVNIDHGISLTTPEPCEDGSGWFVRLIDYFDGTVIKTVYGSTAQVVASYAQSAARSWF